MDELYNHLELEKDDYEYERIIDHYFKDGILFLKLMYVGRNLGKYNTMEVRFEDLNKYITVELVIYIRNHVVE